MYISWLAPTAALLLGYLLGSIPFGLLLAKASGAGDLRKIGSGNIGATNVLRTGRKGIAAATLILDVAKGAVAVLVGAMLAPHGALLAGAGAFLGHCYPIWLRLNGGKGVATYLGIALALHWPCGVVYALVWIAAFATLRYSSVGGMLAAIAAPVSAAALGRFDLVPLFLGLTVVLLWKHRSNILRLLTGTEPKVGNSH
ncbi:glycerol-3-phosphate 1-O-acyltransferase PlsY [Rhizorhapis suberifaciens]|uniref:Glycerol-3-phosphate acyltransferase n=1 Tax=Rhizorhapis suberifaciens TaxID=13656 RepID=A0A840HX02_9SPHN|nr:glycerol-3-phosphate 1-O-acyltransferase PlsY [Rhizorhapis suberifaciens]MBB4642099.1 glycerol-3-phosphate acyltransferase PlsY [Rhizorhapis suberifaciens]